MNILTWNMQGGGVNSNKPIIMDGFLKDGKYDVICTQEATAPSGCWNFVKNYNGVEIYKNNISTNSERIKNSHKDYFALYKEYGNSNNRCSMITYVKPELLMDVSLCECVDGRDMLCVKLSKTLCIGNIHLKSGYENGAYRQFTDFKNYMDRTRMYYFIIGDYNIDALKHTETINSENFFYHIKGKTQKSGGCLDYIYSPHKKPKAFRKLCDPGYCSDHSPIEYEIPIF